MGYTHYWNLKNPTKKTKQQFIDVMLDVDMIMNSLPKFSTSAGGHYRDYPLVVKNGLGEGSPITNNTEILINGDASEDLDHETFSFEYTDKPLDFGFCKTARKPYDFVVCCILISLGNRVDGFEFSSDGGYDDWKDCFKFYEEHVTKKINDRVRNFIPNEKVEEGIQM